MFARSFRSLFAGKRKPIKSKKPHKLNLQIEDLEKREVPASFTAGNLAILDLASASATNTTGSLLELNPFTANPNGGVQGLIGIPSTGANAFKFSASGTSSYISTTSDGTLLGIAGYNTTSTVTDLSSLSGQIRGVETYNPSATESSSPVALFSDTGGGTNQTRAATSPDDTTWYITGKSGIATNNSTPPFPYAVNTGSARSFGGTVYIASTRTVAQGNTTGDAIFTASNITTSSVTVAGLSGVPIDANISDFYLIQSGHFANTYDVLYQLDGSTITKFSLQSVGGSWQSNGTTTLSGPAGLSLVAAPNASGADLYYTTGSTAVHVTDSVGWSSSASGFSVGSPTTLYTVAGTGNDVFLKGIAFVPQAAAAVNTTTDIPTFTPTGTNPYGTNETFTAVVHAASGSTAPTAGTVTFMNGSTVLATATTETTSGTAATFTVSSTTVPVGTYSNITAVYSPGTGFNGSTSSASSVTLTISGTGTTAAVPTFTPTTAFFGQSVAFTDVVTAGSGSTAPTAGTVTFMNGSTVLATTTTAPSTSGLNSTFTVSSTSIPVGPYSNITAVYNPGAGFSGSISSASTVTLTINNNATTTAVPTFTPTTVTVGQPVNFTAVVTDTSTSLAPTAGTVTFMNGSTVLATAITDTTSGATATFTVSSSTIPVGTYSNITAVYAPGTGFAGSTSSASTTALAVNAVTVPVGTFGQWTFENDPTALNNNPAPATGVGTASAIGMTNSYNNTTSTNTDDVLPGVSGDTGTNGLADTSQIWRVRGQSPGNGWSSQAPIGTQGAVFATSTVGYFGPINISFDWYATTQGEANLQLEYTTNGTTWINVPITVPAADANVIAKTNSNSANTVMGSYIQMSGGQQWAPGLTATITDPAAANNANFAIELVNASTGADNIAAAGTPLNNSSGNWRFDNIDMAAPQAYTPGNLVILQAGDGTTSYSAQGPLYLNEIGTSTAQTGLIAVAGTSADALGNVTVTTTGTQNFTAGQNVQISGVQVGSNINSGYNGVYSVLSVDNAGNTFTYFSPLAAGLAAGTPAPAVAGATGGAFAYAVVQQDSIPAVNGGANQPGNQPITIDLSAAAGNGQLNRSYDGSVLNFDGIDSTVNNGGLTGSATPTGQNNRDIGVIGGNPGVALSSSQSNTPNNNPTTTPFYNSTTQGAFYVGDDNRGSIADSPTGPIYSAGHPNQAGGAVSQGVHEFATEGPSIGTQVSASTNIRGITIGFDNREYFSTASGIGGATILNTAGIFTDAQALPTTSNPTADIQVVPALFGASKLGGIFFADVNGDGIVDNGDKLYFLDDGTVGGAGTGGVYVSTWNDSIIWNAWNTPNNVAAASAGFVDHWSVPVKIGDAPVQAGAGGVGQLRGITGTVLGNGTVDLYTTAYDNAAVATSSDNSIIQQWVDPNAGFAITSASESGNTVTITTVGNPNWVSGVTQVQIDGVVVATGTSNGLGGAALTQGYNGIFTVSGSGNTGSSRARARSPRGSRLFPGRSPVPWAASPPRVSSRT